jgi:hypothetical protein
MPFLQQLARAGVVFERAYANGTWTRPVLPTLLTSQSPLRHGKVLGSAAPGEAAGYADRRIHVFEGGFVQQHTLFVTHANDFVGRMDVCFVAYTRDGMISRGYEYFDTGQIEKFLAPARAARRSGVTGGPGAELPWVAASLGGGARVRAGLGIGSHRTSGPRSQTPLQRLVRSARAVWTLGK